jgi:hypothetical protein
MASDGSGGHAQVHGQPILDVHWQRDTALALPGSAVVRAVGDVIASGTDV